MTPQDITKKYDTLIASGQLPFMFKKLIFHNPKNNHELRPSPAFYAPTFNTRALAFRYAERAFLSL